MKKNKNSDNFAQKYWKTFEELVITLLKKKLGNSNDYQIYSHKTPAQNDGGYDGIIFIESPTNLSNELKTLYTILTEAKLRQNINKDLPLSDFAKTLIIAINRNADEVYIYTNLHYSPETYKRVMQFSAATSLTVKLIDIFELYDEMSRFSEVQADFPPQFIQKLLDAPKLHNNKKKIEYTSVNIFENNLPELIGDYRNDLLEKYTEYFLDHNGVFVVMGIQGCGKRLLIKHILNSLQYKFNCRLISLEKFTTIKGYFVYLLSLIWNIDTIEIYNLSEENIDEIMSYIPIQYSPERIKTVLLNILKDVPDEYDNRRDVLDEHLIQYIYYIFVPICHRRKQIFAFINFDKCTDNILNFTNKFIRKFSCENIIILTDLRTDEPHSLIYIDEWSKLNPTTKPIELSEFSYVEYIEYMNKYHSDKDMKTVDKLYKICYPLPIYIDNLISIINDNDLEQLLCQDDLNIKKLYNNDHFKNKLILSSVNNFFIDKTIFCKNLAYLVVFFDGELSLDNINKLSVTYIEAVSTLVDSIYFDIERDYLHIHHILYLQTFQNKTILNDFEYYSVMKMLYRIIDSFEMNTSTKKTKKLEAAIAINETDYVLHNWENICKKLIKQNDFTYSKKILKNILQKIPLCDENKLKIVNCIIKCYLGLNEYNSSDLTIYFSIGKSLEKGAQVTDWNLFCFLMAKYKFSLGKYQEIIILTNMYINTSPDIRYIRALSVKHIYGINACLLSLERGIKHFPENWHLKYAFLDHMHSKYEKIDLEKSWEFLMQIKQYYDKLNLEDQIHFQYNEMALRLYTNRNSNIDGCKALFCKAFENILPIEMGRTHNLLGQMYYLNNNIILAIKEFEISLDIFNKNLHATYIYIPYVNLSLIYDELNDSSKCIEYTLNTLKYLEKYKTKKIKKQLKSYNNETIIEKECAAFIILMELLQKRNIEIYKQYFIKFPEYDNQTHSSSKLPQYYRLGNKFTFRC